MLKFCGAWEAAPACSPISRQLSTIAVCGHQFKAGRSICFPLLHAEVSTCCLPEQANGLLISVVACLCFNAVTGN